MPRFITGYIRLPCVLPITITIVAVCLGKVMSSHGCKIYLCGLYLSGVRNVLDNEKFPLYVGDFEVLESITVFYCCLYMPLNITCQIFCIIFSVYNV